MGASLIEMVVAKVSPHLQVERPLLWLCEKDTTHPRLLPIAIGPFEALAIQMQLDREEPLRPIAYDLLGSMLAHLEAPVRRVVIHAVHRSIYFARVAIEKDKELRELDSRPSDAVALALRTGTPIYVSRKLLELAALAPLDDARDIERAIERFSEHETQLVEFESPAEETEEKPKEKLQNPTPASRHKAKEAPTREGDLLSALQLRMERAVLFEEYEEAARLRDQIESLAGKPPGA